MGHMSIKPCTKESRCEVCWEDGCQQLPGCELNAGRKGMNTDLGPITVRLSEWHALQDANREAHDRIRELEAAVLAEKEACAKLMDAIWQIQSRFLIG